MKKIVSFLFILTLVSLAWLKPQTAQAAEVVGRETYTVSWDRPSGAGGFQVYFGQTNTNKKEHTVFGLRPESRSVTLSYLKACTSYSWNVKYQLNDKWHWLWGSDKQFTTGGACSASDAAGRVTTIAGGQKTVITGVGSATATWTPADGATGYNIYYREAANKSWTHSVSTGPNTTAVTINHLNPSTTYHYRVAAKVGNKEIWQAEKMLKGSVSSNPVLGVQNTRSMYRNELNTQPTRATRYGEQPVQLGQ